MISTREIMKVIVYAGLTYSPEEGDKFPMRIVPCTEVVAVIAQYLIEHGVAVDYDMEVGV